MSRRTPFLKALLASTALAALTAAAGAQEELTAPDLVGKPDAPKSMTFRVNADQTYANQTPSQAEGYKKLFQAFAEKHPDWQVKLEFYTTDIGGEHARMLEQARAGRAPDCAAVDSYQLALFIKNNALQPITEFFTKEEIDDLFPFIKSGVTGSDGQIYAWWWNTDLRVLYRNKDLVPNAPQTWDELKAAALEAINKGATEGVLFNGGRWEGTTFDWLAHFWSQGGKLVDDTGKPIFGEGENREKMLKALNFYKDLVDSGAAPKRVATIVTYDDFNAAAASGQTAMFEGGHWQYNQLKEAMPEEEFAKWEISELPGPTADQRATGTGGWTLASLSKDPEKVKLCMELVREVYMGGANNVTGQVPTQEKLFESETFKTPFFDQLKEYLVHGQARPGVPIYPEISNQIQIMMGEVLSGTKEPEAALNDAWSRVNDAYAKM